MSDCDLNIVAIVGPQSNSVLKEIQSNIPHDFDNFGIYFTISNKYYTARIYFLIFDSYNIDNIPCNTQAIIFTANANDAEKIISDFNTRPESLKFIWITNSLDENLNNIQNSCLEYGFELLEINDNKTVIPENTNFTPIHNDDADEEINCKDLKGSTYQVPLLSNESINNPSLKLFRSLECHKWINSNSKNTNDISLEHAIEVIRETKEMNMNCNDVNSRIKRATRAIIEIKSFLE